MNNFALLLVAYLLLGSCFKKTEDPLWETHENVSYGNESGQVFDAYLPKNSNDQTKVFVLIHGGGWVGGKKSDMNEVLKRMKTSFPDYAIINLEYQLASTQKPAFPMQLTDIELALNKIESEYTLSKQYALLGVSAGGHLSLLAAYKNNSQGRIKMACSIVGPTDLVAPDFGGYATSQVIIYQATGQTFSTTNPYLKENSPLHVLDSNNVVPTILFYGNNDYLIPTSQGQSLSTKLQTLNVNSRFVLYNGGHFDWSQTDNEDLLKQLKEFVVQNF